MIKTVILSASEGSEKILRACGPQNDMEFGILTGKTQADDSAWVF
jgi:hypothetical protein